jgi:hypothetical protein
MVLPIVDPDVVAYNRRIVLSSTISVLVISNTSYILRLIARRKQNQRLQWDDYIMGLALPFSESDPEFLTVIQVISMSTLQLTKSELVDIETMLEHSNRMPLLSATLLTFCAQRLHSCSLSTLRYFDTSQCVLLLADYVYRSDMWSW